MSISTNLLKLFRYMLISSIFMISVFSKSQAQYCDAKTTYQDEYICEFHLHEIASTDCKWSDGISDYTDMLTELKMGQKYTVKVVNGNAWSGDQVAMWIDYNQDYKFDESTEVITLETNDGAKTFSADFTVPTSATAGKTRLRVRMVYSTTPVPCDGQNYGEVEDYTVDLIPPIPDAQMTQLTSPKKPFLVGSYPVIATLRSNEETAMTYCNIDWWVNNEFQGTYTWTGNMRNGQTANINFGNYDFSYSEDETQFNPFRIRFTVRDVNGKNPDADPSNDTYQTNVTPSLNDCGAIGFFGPPEGFGAGVTPVRARVMNYAPKPLTSVKVYWAIDGQDLPPKTFTGIHVKQNQYIDLDMGTYTFYNKTPLGPFTVELYTESPNGVNDEDPTNDSYEGGIGPSLAAGTYFAGGANAHFSSPAEAASYLNSSGVFGPGTVNIEIRPGTYNGQIILNNPLENNNDVIFKPSAGQHTVTLSNSPSSANNFVLQIANISNVKFEYLTIQNNNSNISNAGRLVEANNVNGLTFHKVNFNGVANSPKNHAYNLLNLQNTNNLTLLENDFNNGSIAVYSNIGISPVIDITGNNINNFSWYAIYNSINDGGNGDNVMIAGNTMKITSGANPNGAIYSINGTTISNNNISDIVGTGNANDALISVSHTSPDASHISYIEGNKINNCTNMNGIQVNNAFAVVNRNSVVMSQSANYGAALLDLTNAYGAAGNNMLMGTNIMGVDIDNSPEMSIIYNTVSVDFNANPVLRVNGSSSTVMRNIFVNKGNGPAVITSNANGIDDNVIYTNGNTLANISGVNYSDIAEINNAGFMLNSREFEVEFFSPSDPHLKVYNGSLLFESNLYNAIDNPIGNYVEVSDYDGETRTSYYAGSDEISLSIYIERQTDGFVDCVGTTENLLTVSAAIGYNAPMTYQWELDNVPIPGATEPILFFPNLRHNQAGIYRCQVFGPGNTMPVYSRPVAVYITRPTDITREPKTQYVFTGSVATLSFDAHVNGKNIEEAIANDEVIVRWFKYVDEANDIPLTDNQYISGSRSNYLTFRNFKNSDEGTYYATIEGQCGKVETVKANLYEENLEITIVQQPMSNAVCVGNEANFVINATTLSTKTLKYQWFLNGSEITDELPKIEGSNTNNLRIQDVQDIDEGNYHVVVSLEDTEISMQSEVVTLTAKTSPVITMQPMDAEIQEDRQLLLEVVAVGNDAEETLNYQWYHNGTPIEGATEALLLINRVTHDNAGDYYVEVTNDCGVSRSNNVAVTVVSGVMSVLEQNSNGFSLFAPTPNPVQNSAVISYIVPEMANVKITMSDATGISNIILTEGMHNEGTYTINFDAAQYNLASGTYFYFLESNGVKIAQKMVVVR